MSSISFQNCIMWVAASITQFINIYGNTDLDYSSGKFQFELGQVQLLLWQRIMYSVQITVKNARHLSTKRDMNYIITKLIIRSLMLHTYSKADFVLKMHFGICLSLLTDAAAVDGKKGSAVRLTPHTLRKVFWSSSPFKNTFQGFSKAYRTSPM